MRSVRETIAVGLALFGLIFVLEHCTGCRDASVARETTRATVLTLAEGVRTLDLACASVARGRRDLGLADRCADAYELALEALKLAENGVDLWDRGAAGDVPCAASRALSAMRHLVSLVTAAGGRVPPAAEDALRLAPPLAEACRG